MSQEATAPVVVGVDGTPQSDGALRYAAAEARCRRVNLHVVHVRPGYVPMAPMYPYIPEQFEATSRAVLRDARATVRELDPRLSVTTELTTGSRVPELLAGGRRGQLIVLGLESVFGVERLVSGAVTAAVAARSTVPVIAVPADWRPAEDPGPVVVGFKGGRWDPALLSRAFTRAEQLGTSVLVVHAWNVTGPYADAIEERAHVTDWITRDTERIEHDLRPWREAHPEVPVEVRVVHEQPARTLLEASTGAAELLVARRPGGRLGAHLGSTVRALLQRSAAPVTVMPGDSDRPASEPDLVLEDSGSALK
jgi:nucleotide-binding universal stress UspA family protein